MSTDIQSLFLAVDFSSIESSLHRRFELSGSACLKYVIYSSLFMNVFLVDC